jgi:hypothetical protein
MDHPQSGGLCIRVHVCQRHPPASTNRGVIELWSCGAASPGLVWRIIDPFSL